MLGYLEMVRHLYRTLLWHLISRFGGLVLKTEVGLAETGGFGSAG